MAVKILAVDDSATMRQILEMTFAGEDAEVTTVASGQQAVDAARQMNPDVVLADASMDGMDGYAVAEAIKANGGNPAVVILSSQHTPYDEAKGSASGVDDHIAKPFDSAVVIEKVAQLASAERAPAVQSTPPRTTPGGTSPAAAGTPQSARPAGGGRVSKRTMAFGTSPIAPPQPPAPPKPPAAPEPPKRPVLELADEPEITIDEPPAPPKPSAPQPPAPQPPKAPVAAAPPKPAPPQPSPPKPAASPAAAATASGGAMAQKLDDLGLSKDQIEAVLALSREVVEQVVWEVVPDLAETLIKEEIARLTRE